MRYDFGFSDQSRYVARSIWFLGRGRKGTGLEGRSYEARAEERAYGAKALKRPWRTATGRHTEIHDRRAHRHKRSSHCFFSGFVLFFTRQ